MQSDSSQWKSQSLSPECERAQLLITRHIDGEAKPEDARDLRKHIDACPRCRKALDIQTRQSHRVAMALQTLWPADAIARKPVSLERFRGAVLRAASLLLILLTLTFLAQRTYAPTPARQNPQPAPVVRSAEAEKDKPKIAEVEPDK